jgi:hypothetical protein
MWLVILTLAACHQNQSTPGVIPNHSAPTRSPEVTGTASPQPAGSLQEALTSTVVEPSSPVPTIHQSTANPGTATWQTDWLRGIPCAAPCFAGITPGRTTASEAKQILQTHPDVGAIFDEGTYVEWEWKAFPGERGGTFPRPRQHSPEAPIPSISPWLPAVPFAEVLRVFGPPSDVLATSTEAPTEEIGTPEFQPGTMQAYTLGFLYRSYGIRLYADVPVQEKPVLTTTLILRSPTFFDPTANFTPGLNLGPVVPWQDWQSFDFYCRDLYTFEPCP